MKPYLIKFYLYCQWQNLPPTYRVYFNGELMTERTYIWSNDEHVLQECIPITVATDKATILIEQVGQHSGIFSVENILCEPAGLDITVRIV